MSFGVIALCVSRVVNTHRVLCGSFYAPSKKFHSFVHSWLRLIMTIMIMTRKTTLFNMITTSTTTVTDNNLSQHES